MGSIRGRSLGAGVLVSLMIAIPAVLRPSDARAGGQLVGDVHLVSAPEQPRYAGPDGPDLRFRHEFGFSTDLAFIDGLKARARRDPALSRSRVFGVLLSPSEEPEMEFRAGRLELAERDSRLQSYLSEHADTYGGIYMDHLARGMTTILFTRDVAARTAELRQIFQYPNRLVVRRANNSLAALESLQRQIDSDLGSLSRDLGVVGVGINVIGNDLQLASRTATQATVDALRARYGAVPIEVMPGSAPVHQGEVAKDAPPVRGGQEFNQNSPTGFACTVGYVMTDASRTNYYATTAGHCGATSYYQEQYSVGPVVKTTLGSQTQISSDAELIQLAIPTDGKDSSFNFKWLDTNDNLQPDYIRLDSTQCQGCDNVNDTVCLSARASIYNCAQETTKNQTIPDGQYSLIFQRQVNFLGISGDSGGTWLNPILHEAVGQQEGSFNNQDYFTQVYDLAQNLGESIVTTNYEEFVQHDNPALWYRLDDSLYSQTGEYTNPTADAHPTVVANSGYGGQELDGGVNGDVTFLQKGALHNDPDQAALFDGLTGSITIPAPTQALAPPVTAFTAEAWFMTTSRATQYIFSLSGAPTSPTVPNNPLQPPVGLGISNGVPFAVVTDQSGASHQISGPSSQLYTDATWHHIALTDDGNVLTLYVDGTQLGQTTVTGPPAYNGNQAGVIGSSGGQNYFDGYIDEPAAYLYALSPARISLHASFGPL